jgi:tetratricopeptide (TPR) repeat protein
MDGYASALGREKTGDFRAAIAIFERCLEDGAVEKGDLLYHLGWCHENLKDHEKAAERYGQCVAASPDDRLILHALFRIGFMAMAAGDAEKAVPRFRECLERARRTGCENHPCLPHAQYWLAMGLESRGRYLDALSLYRQAATEPALQAEALYRRVLCLIHVGSIREAREACRTFQAELSAGTDPRRFEELKGWVRKEEASLERCLAEEGEDRQAPPG